MGLPSPKHLPSQVQKSVPSLRHVSKTPWHPLYRLRSSPFWLAPSVIGLVIRYIQKGRE